jgi:hypothetical protein
MYDGMTEKSLSKDFRFTLWSSAIIFLWTADYSMLFQVTLKMGNKPIKS